MTLAAVTLVVVLILDQVTKALALAHLPPGRPVPIIDGLCSLTRCTIARASSHRWQPGLP